MVAVIFSLFSSLALAQGYQPQHVETLDQVVAAEGTVLASEGYMLNAIEYHRCLDQAGVVQDIQSTFFFKESSLVARYGYQVTSDELNTILSHYTRDQIIAAETAELAGMKQYDAAENGILGPYHTWLKDLNEAKAAGNTGLYDYLLTIPVAQVAVATIIETAAAVPFAGMDAIFNWLDHKSCTPIAE